jgi:manganese/zinc/iron transport system permease protein
MSMNLIDFFLDPIFRAPTLGCILMAISTSLIGVIAVLKKRSLVGETISHATYPGVVLGIFFFAVFFPKHEKLSIILVLFFAYLFAILAMKLISILETHFKVKSDASLCFILASFFGFGILFSSHIQFAFTNHYKQIQMYLYGQSATMTDAHIVIYAILTSLIISLLYIFYRPLQLVLFDASHAKSLNINPDKINRLFNHLLAIALVLGIRSAGIILVSGMLVAPAIAARQYTDKLSKLFILAAILSSISAFFGNYLAVQLSILTSKTLPSGPLIVLISSSIAFLSLLFAPKNGFLARLIRIFGFKKRCLQENILKYIWKYHPKHLHDIKSFFHLNHFFLKFTLQQMMRRKLLTFSNGLYSLTEKGEMDAINIVRLHRLWELYLANHLGMNAKKVHPSAEQMEHILTPEIEKKLTKILNNPKNDPHKQPIP